MTDSTSQQPLTFTGRVHFQFRQFLQGHMSTDVAGNQIFVGVVRGMYGTPPNGSFFDAQVKLSVGAQFTDDAYEVVLPPALALLGARAEVRKAAYDYIDGCMRSMVGPSWNRMTGLRATNNVIVADGPMHVLDFERVAEGW
jgi:hypothetical protein